MLRRSHLGVVALLGALSVAKQAEACAEQCRTFSLGGPLFEGDGPPAVKTNFGLLRQTGERWTLSCDGLAGAQWLGARWLGEPSLPTQSSSSGVLFVSTPNGLAYSESVGCAWEFSQGDVKGQSVVALSLGETTWAIAADATSLVQSLQVSTDGGRSFRTTLRFPEHVIQDQYHTKFDSVAQGGSRVYVAGAALYPYRPKLLYSDDGGQSWKEREPDLGAWGRNERYVVVEVSGAARRRVLASRSHVDEMTDSLWLSEDAAASFSQVLTLPEGERLVGVVRSPQSGTLYVATQSSTAGANGKLYISRDDGSSFDAPITNSFPYRCLGEHRGTLYFCSQDEAGIFGILRSDDEGQSLDWLMRVDDIGESSECGDGASPGSDRVCLDATNVLCSLNDAAICSAPVEDLSAGEGEGATAGAAMETSASGISEAGCRVASTHTSGGAWLMALAAFVARRRRAACR